MSSLNSLFAWIGHVIRQLLPQKQQTRELAELEAKFQDTQLDPERLQDRQLSTSIRSGRG